MILICIRYGLKLYISSCQVPVHVQFYREYSRFVSVRYSDTAIVSINARIDIKRT